MTAIVAAHPQNIFAYEESSAVSDDSRTLDMLLKSARKHYVEPAFWLPIEATYGKLLEVFAASAKPDWDGYAATPLSFATVLAAIRLIKLLPPSLPEPELVPESDGTIGFEWYLEELAKLFSRVVFLAARVSFRGGFAQFRW